MNGEKGLEDLLNYITGHKELDLDLDLELESEGLVRHAQPKEIRKNEKEQKTINRCLQSNGESLYQHKTRWYSTHRNTLHSTCRQLQDLSVWLGMTSLTHLCLALKT